MPDPRPVGRLRRLVTAPLPVPPAWLRIGPLRAGAFGSPLRSERLTARLGVVLGAAFAVCFVTGLVSHGIQHPPWWFDWPSRPVGLYRVSQGLHVATGLVCVPLLLAKLWAVYPRLFEWPPVRDLAHLLSRASVLVLVASGLFQLVTGVLNVSRWYAPMPFLFTVAHHWTAWVAVGALIVHIGVKLPVVSRALRRSRPEPPPAGTAAGSRRAVLAAVGTAAGTLTLVTAGQTVRPLSTVDVLGARRPDIGPQGLPVNKSASEARVTAAVAHAPAYRLRVVGPRPVTLSPAELAAMPQHSVELPIACVEGWSAGAHWTGVRIRDLLALVAAPSHSRVRFESLQPQGLYRQAVLPAAHGRDQLSLLALRLNGHRLDLDHGYPCRLVAPNLPGVMQTKWVSRMVVLP